MQSLSPVQGAHVPALQLPVAHTISSKHVEATSSPQREFGHFAVMQSPSAAQGVRMSERQFGAAHFDPGHSKSTLHAAHAPLTHRSVAHERGSLQAPPMGIRQSPRAQVAPRHSALFTQGKPARTLQAPALSHTPPGAGQLSASLAPGGTFSHWPVELHA